MPVTIFLDLESGLDSNDGTTFANRKKTLAGASAIAQPGDTVRIMASTTPNSLGVNGTFAKGSPTITLASAVNATIENCETAWTASANVTCTTSTIRKQGAFATVIDVASAFTTGLAAYKSFTELDLSAYQQLSLWYNSGTAGFVGGFTIKLCSDTAGAAPVNSFSIPASVTSGASQWNRVTVDLGSAMGASIQSIAIYIDSDIGRQVITVDNIVACKAPGTGELSHKTLIGKANSLGAGGDDSETWYAIRAIEGTTITLDLLNSSNAGSTTNGRYWGVSETVTAYSLFPSYVPTNVVSADLQWTAGGTDQATLTISGGWNRTDMTTQTGQTWLAVGNAPSATLFASFVASYLESSRLNFFLTGNTTDITGTNIDFSAQSVSGASFTVNVLNSTIDVISTNTTNNITLSGFNNTVSIGFFGSQGTGLASSSMSMSTITLSDDSVPSTLVISPFSKLIFNGTTYGSFGEASVAAAVRTNLATELATITNLDDTLEDDGGTYRFTANALEQGPVGGDATEANQSTILADIASVAGSLVSVSNDVVAVGALTSAIKDVTDLFTFQGPNVQALAMNEGDTGVDLTKMLEMFSALACGQFSATDIGGGETELDYKKRDGTTTSFTAIIVNADRTRTTTGALS